jgi:type IV pilus assembly protein PilV
MPRHARGMSLIEVMVALLVLAVGLLGIAAMQSLALRGSQGSLESTQAVMATNSILESMRANPTESYNLGKTCKSSDVTGSTLKANDQREWIKSLRNTIGDNDKTCGQISGCPGACVVTVFWDDSRAGGSDSRSLSVGAQI